MDEHAFDGEVGKRLNQMVSIPVSIAETERDMFLYMWILIAFRVLSESCVLAYGFTEAWT